MKVYIIRHGESETNRKGLWTGWLDVPLTENGIADAQKAGKLLAGTAFDKVCSSDLLRARSTVEAAIPGCEYDTYEILREVNVGNIAGKPLSSVTDEDMRAIAREGYVRFFGESREEFRQRVLTFMKILEAYSCDKVAVFSHAGFLRTFLDIVVETDLPRKNVCCKNCTVAIFEYDASVWRLHSWINLD